MNCQIAQNNLSAYLDRELPGDAMIAIRRHVDVCESCQAELESVRQVKAGLAALPVVGPSDQFATGVMRLVSGASPAPRLPFGLVVATSVAAAVLAVIVFNVFFNGPSRPSYAEDANRFDAESDRAVTAPDFGGHAPLIPVGR